MAVHFGVTTYSCDLCGGISLGLDGWVEIGDSSVKGVPNHYCPNCFYVHAGVGFATATYPKQIADSYCGDKSCK